MSNSFDIAISRNFMLRSFYFDIPWPTKYTAIYATFEGQKLRGQYSENLVLWIYECPFNSGGKIFKEERIMKVLRIRN